MRKVNQIFAAFLLAGAATTLPVASVQAAVVANKDAATFVSSLGAEAFTVLKSGNKSAVRSKFRDVLSEHFALDAIGNRLIRRWTRQITPAQRVAYKAAVPSFIIGTYSDNLFDYANASMKVIRVAPAGSSFIVTTQVQKPGAQPISVVWTVGQLGGNFKVTNATVGGINLTMTQSQNFDAIVQRQGFDALVAMMKSAD